MTPPWLYLARVSQSALHVVQNRQDLEEQAFIAVPEKLIFLLLCTFPIVFQVRPLPYKLLPVRRCFGLLGGKSLLQLFHPVIASGSAFI